VNRTHSASKWVLCAAGEISPQLSPKVPVGNLEDNLLLPMLLVQGFFRKALESRVTAGLLLAAAVFLLGSAAIAGELGHAVQLSAVAPAATPVSSMAC
jgi:hypothetical protein